MNIDNVEKASDLKNRIHWLQGQLILNTKILEAYQLKDGYVVQRITYHAEDLLLPHSVFIDMINADASYKCNELAAKIKELEDLK